MKFIILILLNIICGIYGQYRSPLITEHPADLLVPRGEPATLNCHADGRPKPNITWYKNDKPFRLKKEDTRHVLLDNGDLFFLWVLQTENEDDSGLYWCQASNSVGTVRSKNATLEIAALKEEFVAVPEDAQVAEGETALLRCIPPKGHPQPIVVWIKDGNEIDLASKQRFKLVDKGNLVITSVRKSDSGSYVCKARNVYGSRETNSAMLSVLVPPHFVSTSQKSTGTAGSTIELVCRVGGDPPPEVFWEKLAGELPIERMSQEENGQVLRIRHVNAKDQGIYICRAENPAGSVKSNISLSIHSRPVIAVHPSKARIGINGTVSFECETSGNPSPTTYWTHEGTGVVVSTGQTWGEGRVYVDFKNTLTIHSVTKDDEGFYVCSAVGIAGSASARAHLEVQSVTDMPPPLIALGAPNQTLPLNTEGEMPCEARGTPEPRIVWFVGDKPFQPSDRASITPFGTLRIERLKDSDTGVYTCHAISESGTTEWITSLVVANPTNPNVGFFKMPSDTALPEPPESVTVQNINSTTVTIGWRKGRPGSSPILGYVIQMWSPDSRGPWTTATMRPTTLTNFPGAATITSLSPDTLYIFVVRASNSHGLSRPSDMTPVIRTLDSDQRKKLSLQEIRARIAVPSVRLESAESISPTAIAIKWQLLVDPFILEGIYVRYRMVGRPKNAFGSTLSVETVYLHKTQKPPPEEYIITGLHAGREYEVFITPFYESVEGQPSSAKRVVLEEGHPIAAPSSVKYEIINDTSVELSWKKIPFHLSNGIIVTYIVQVKHKSQSSATSLTVSGNSSSVILNNLKRGTDYQATIHGQTSSGSGPASDPLIFALPSQRNEAKTPAGIDSPPVSTHNNQYLIIGISVVSVFIFLFLFLASMYIYKHRRKSKLPAFFVKGHTKDPWCDYPDCWNESCKSITETSASSNHMSQIKTNSLCRGFPSSSSQQFCTNNSNFDNGLYKVRQPEDLYEDPDGLKLVSFAKYSAKRCFSPEPYATTPLISDNYMKGSIQPTKLNIPISEFDNKEMGMCATISPPNICNNQGRFLNCNPHDGRDMISAPILQFPPPPPSASLYDEQYCDNISAAGKNKNSFTRFLQQQLPYSLAGSSSGGSQKSHDSPIVYSRSVRGNLPHSASHYNDNDCRLVQPNELPVLVENKLSEQQNMSPYLNNIQENNYSQPTNASPNSSVMGDGEESESDMYSNSSVCSSNPALTFSNEKNFLESLRNAEGARRLRLDSNEVYTQPHNIYKGSSLKSSDKKSQKVRKPYEHLFDVSNLGVESVTSPLV